MLSQASRLKTETADSSFAISPANCPLRRPCRRLIKPRILPFAGGSATTAQTFSRSYPLGECDLLIQKREMNRANLPLSVVDVDHGQFIGATFVQIAVFIGACSLPSNSTGRPQADAPYGESSGSPSCVRNLRFVSGWMVKLMSRISLPNLSLQNSFMRQGVHVPPARGHAITVACRGVGSGGCMIISPPTPFRALYWPCHGDR